MRPDLLSQQHLKSFSPGDAHHAFVFPFTNSKSFSKQDMFSSVRLLKSFHCNICAAEVCCCLVVKSRSNIKYITSKGQARENSDTVKGPFFECLCVRWTQCSLSHCMEYINNSSEMLYKLKHRWIRWSLVQFAVQIVCWELCGCFCWGCFWTAPDRMELKLLK